MSLKQQCVDLLETVMRYMYGWLAENDEILGRIVYMMHIFVFIMVLVLIFISHTIYPVIWFQVLVFILVSLVWIQHMILHTCICTSLERRLIGDAAPIAMDIVLETFNIPVTRDSRMGVTLLMSSLFVLFLGLELVARGSMYFRELMEWSLWG